MRPIASQPGLAAAMTKVMLPPCTFHHTLITPSYDATMGLLGSTPRPASVGAGVVEVTLPPYWVVKAVAGGVVGT